MTDQSLESLLASLECPEFLPGHQDRLAVRLARRDPPVASAMLVQQAEAARRHATPHHLQFGPLAAWVALAAMILLAAMLALRPVRTPSNPPAASPRWAAATESVIIRTDLFASRRHTLAIDIRRWSTLSGTNR